MRKNAIEIILPVLCFILPVFFLPATTEYYESAKVLLIAGIAALILIYWGLKVIRDGQLVLRKSYVSLPIVAFVGSTFLSYLFSVDRHLSTFGYYGRLSSSIVFYFIIILLFFLFNGVIDGTRVFEKLLKGIVLGIDFLGITVILQHYGALNSLTGGKFDFLSKSAFTMMGSSGVVPYVFIICILLSSYLFYDLKNKWNLVIGFTSIILNSFLFMFVVGNPSVDRNWMLYLYAGISIGIMFLLNQSFLKERNLIAVVLSLSLLLSFIVVNVNPFKSAMGLNNNPYKKETALQFEYSWRVMGNVLAASPKRALFGAGPDTFIESFARYKPVEYNNTDYWSVKFSKSSNEILEILTNLGIVGAALFLIFLFSVTKLAEIPKNIGKENAFQSMALISIVLSIGVLSLFSVYNSFIWIVLLLSTVGVVLMHRLDAGEGGGSVISLRVLNPLNMGTELIPRAFTAICFIGTLVLTIFVGRSYLADVFYTQAARYATSDKTEESLNALAKSFRYGYEKDYAHRLAAVQSLVTLEKISSAKDPDESAQKVFLQQTLNEIDKSLSLSLNNVENWDGAATIYERLIVLTNGQYGDQAAQALKMAINLDPLNPHFHSRLGTLLASARQFDDAKVQIEYAISLRPSYFRSYIVLGEMYVLKKDYTNAINSLNAAKKLLPEDSEIVRSINTRIVEIQDLSNGVEEESDTKIDSTTETGQEEEVEEDLTD